MAANLRNLIDIDLLSYFKSKLDLLFANKVDKETGKGLSSNDYTTTEKTKLANIASGAQVNVLEGVQVAGTSITPTNKIANIPAATTSAAGVMSAADKTKLEAIEASADVNIIEKIKVNGTEQTIASQDKSVDISVPVASSTTPSMDGTAAVGTGTTWARADHVHPSDTTKVDKVTGKGLSTNDYTTAEKNKLSGISAGAQENVIEAISIGTVGGYEDASINSSTKTATIYSPKISSDGTNWDWLIDVEYQAANTNNVAYEHIMATPINTSNKLLFPTTGGLNSAISTATSSLAPKASPALTGTPTAPTAATGTSTTQIATTAFVANAVAAAAVGSTMFRGTVNTGTDISGLTSYYAGWYWLVETAGTYAGQTCEAGDMIYCIEDYSSAYSASDFTVIQNNIDASIATNAQIDALFEE